jgi:hypothetical protein
VLVGLVLTLPATLRRWAADEERSRPRAPAGGR